MLLLVTDTSGKHGGVALARAGEGAGVKEVEVIEEVPLAGGTFSAQLVPQISELLAKHGFGKADLGAFIVVSGPGSFTGLRVGLAAIKALAEVLLKPIVPVSLLEVIALASHGSGRVVAALDAGRGEVYVGEYDLGNAAKLIGEQLLPRDAFLAQANEAPVATPDTKLAEMATSAGLRVIPVKPPGPGEIAGLGWKKLQRRETVSTEALEANYIRRSDAEIFSTQSSDS
jgi:tRNA threonylcarbamoyladenosine biosynthesis protein TsaB